VKKGQTLKLLERRSRGRGTFNHLCIRRNLPLRWETALGSGGEGGVKKEIMHRTNGRGAPLQK